VGDLVEELKTGKPSTHLDSPAFATVPSNRSGVRHQTDILALYKPRPRPAMTK
jgi:hypothetical protein